MQFEPSQLELVDRVEVVTVSQNSNWDFVNAASATKGVVFTQDDSARAAALFRALPSGEQARCHIPPYILRFIANGQRVAEFSMCWQCNNAHGKCGADQAYFEFNGASAPAKALYEHIRTALARATLTRITISNA